jgi:hypothetical protein
MDLVKDKNAGQDDGENREFDRIQELCSDMYQLYPYDNFSTRYERDIVDTDRKGGNCVYLNRLFFFSKVMNDSVIKAEDCKLVVSKKGVQDGGDANHVIIVYKGVFVIELSGADAYVLRIGGGSQSAYEARFGDSPDTVVVVKRATTSKAEEIVTSFNMNDLYIPAETFAGRCMSPRSKNMRDVIAANRKVYYSTRYRTGQAQILLSLSLIEEKGERTYSLLVKVGYFTKTNSYKKIGGGRVLPFKPGDTAADEACKFVADYLTTVSKVHMGYINMNFLKESLDEWLAHTGVPQSSP